MPDISGDSSLSSYIYKSVADQDRIVDHSQKLDFNNFYVWYRFLKRLLRSY